MQEEAGLVINKLFLKSTSTVIRPDGLHLLILTYKCICKDNTVVLSNEHSSFKWLNIDDIMSDTTIPEWIKRSIGDCL
jgi:hypothetical protein